ncbi:hypothetical protein DVH05_000134 [Phytophthora capsici]|nr:hypothetical protein DVH05_000134 [Phytophthora capsici]
MPDYYFVWPAGPLTLHVVADALSRAPAAVRAIVRPRDGRLAQRARKNGTEPAPVDTVTGTGGAAKMAAATDTPVAVIDTAVATDTVAAIGDTALVNRSDTAASTGTHTTTGTRTSTTAGTRTIATAGPRTVAICGTPATGSAVAGTVAVAVAGPVPTTAPALKNAEI